MACNPACRNACQSVGVNGSKLMPWQRAGKPAVRLAGAVLVCQGTLGDACDGHMLLRCISRAGTCRAAGREVEAFNAVCLLLRYVCYKPEDALRRRAGVRHVDCMEGP